MWVSGVHVLVCGLGLALALGCQADCRSGDRAPKLTGAPASGGQGGHSAQAGAGDGAATDIPNAPPPTAPKAATLPEGMFEPRPELDRDADFAWQETVPGAGGCQPGTYEGMFECGFLPLDAPPDWEPFAVTGPLSLTLERSMDGEFLVIADGDLAAVAQLVFGMRSKLSGTLDCSTLALDAMAVDGRWAFGDPVDSLLQGGTFEGDLNGTLDSQSLVLSGNWQLADLAFGTCDGEWVANYVP